MTAKQISLSETPPIPDLLFRYFGGERDYPAMLAVMVASEAADNRIRTETLAQFAGNYGRLKNCDPLEDLIVAEVRGELVGYLRGFWWDDANYGRVYEMTGFLDPAWRAKGLERAMLRWMERRLQKIARTHPTEQPKFFQGWASEHQTGLAALFEEEDYRPFREYFEMSRSSLENLPNYPLPPGLEIRAAKPEHYPAIWQSVDETSQDEWPYSPPTEADYHAWINDNPLFQPELWQIAWDLETERVAGHVLTFINHAENEKNGRKRGYTEGIGVDRAWRRRGVAKALIGRSLLAQKEAGMTESALGADGASESGVTRLYERCGFKIVERDTVYRKPLLTAGEELQVNPA